MKPKIKLIYLWPIFVTRSLWARKIAKKIIKYADEDRYPMQWRNDYVLKKAKKFLKFLNVEIEVLGYDHIPRGTSLMVANHASAIDASAILTALENPGQSSEDLNFMPVFLGKKELKASKKFVGFMDILNTFYLDRQNPRQALAMLDAIATHAKENRKHIVIFPEGTRSQDGQLQAFKSGAFRVAKKAFVPIIPITINNTLAATNFNRTGKLRVQVIFHPPIKPLAVISMQHVDIAKKVQAIIAKDLQLPIGNRSKQEAHIV